MEFTIPIDVAEAALQFVPSEDRYTWVRMGKALHDEYGDAAKHVWDQWSQGSDSYKETDAKTVWKSIARMSTGKKPVTIGTLLWEAKNRGFILKQSHHVKLPTEEIARKRAEREARREKARLAEEAAHRRAAAKAKATWDAASPAPADHPYLVRKGVQPHTLRHVDQWVKEVVDEESGEVSRITIGNALLVPAWAAPGRLASLQAIFPSSKNRLRRDKDYLTDGEKNGSYCLLGRISADTHIVIICEGWATGATLHEATEHPVMVAFDTSGLEPVATALRLKLPGVTIVLAADNDAWVKPRADGTPFNPGIEAAQRAAKAVSGVVAVPKFIDLASQPTDFNDLAAQAGPEAVASQIEQALKVGHEPEPDPVPPAEVDEGAQPEPAAPPPAPGPAEEAQALSALDRNGHFSILGYQHRKHFIFTHGKRQILEFTVGDMSDAGLIELAPLDWWEENFGDNKGGIYKKAVIEWIVRTAEKKGVYDFERLRGRGAWVDNGRIVYHHGGYLSVDGVPTDVTDLRSRYVYELQKSLPEPAEQPLSADDGRRLVELTKLFRWAKPGSAALLAGWVALAPVCGALKWRPHVWITGGAGTGKSTVLNDFAHTLMGGADVFAQGASSEAGIRQTLKADARPVLYDEAEKNDDRERMRVDAILALIRQASTESQAQTLKGSAGGDAMAFHIRSMFCLASIQVGIEHQADRERISVLSLRPKREDSDKEGTWERIKGELEWLRHDEELPRRMLRRSLDLLPNTLKNIAVFTKIAARRFGNQRDGDQYGTLLAGCWSLIETGVATESDAGKLIDEYDWSEHLESSDNDESQLALGVLMSLQLNVSAGLRRTVHELVREAFGCSAGGIGRESADDVLQRYGMRIMAGDNGRRLVISNNSQTLKEMINGTAFGADLRGLLLRLPFADRMDNKPVKFNGVQSKCVSISMEDVLMGAIRVKEQPDEAAAPVPLNPPF